MKFLAGNPCFFMKVTHPYQSKRSKDRCRTPKDRSLLQINAKIKNSNSDQFRGYEHISELGQAPTSINTWVLIIESTKLAIFSLVALIKA